MTEWMEFGAVVFSGLFAGAATYVSIVEQSAREEADKVASLITFKVIFHKAARFQIPLLFLSVLFSFGSFYFTTNLLWLLISIALALIIPFTILVLMPLNHTLLATEPEHPELSSMLKKWGPLHFVRTITGFGSFITSAYLAILI